jgi:hypothetical protein
MITSLRHCSRWPHQENMTLVGVGTTAPGVTIALHSVEDALKAPGAGRGRDFVIGIGLQDKGGITSQETRVSTFGVHRVKQAINENRVQKRRQRAALRYPTMHSQGRGLAAVDTRSGRAALVKGINEAPEFSCHAFVSKASKKGLVHNSVIRLAPVEEEEVGELPPLHARAYGGVKSEKGVRSPSPMPETVLVIAELDMRTRPLQQQVAEQFADGREQRQAPVVGAVREVP